MQQIQSISNDHSLSRRMLVGILSGVFLEYFDYTLYGFSAPFIASSFFPAESPAIELLMVWAVFAISFLLRPLGAIIFSHFADRMGRRHVLIISILMMSFATIAIGFIPTFQQIGILASTALILCRIIQGFAVSTEYSGCSTYLLEFKKTRQGFISGIITSASGFGVFCASLLVLSFNSLGNNRLLLANWRWPFIIAGVLVGLLGFYLRLDLLESPAFLAIKQQNRVARLPLLQLFKQSPSALIKGIIISAYAGIAIIVIEIYLPSYLQTHFGMQKVQALQLATYLALMEACFAICWGAISDYLGRINTMTISGILIIIGIFPLLQLFHQTDLFYYVIAATLLAIIVAAIDGPMAAFLTNSFPTATRYTGVSISYNVGAAIFGGLSPTVLIALQHHLSMSHVLSKYLILSAIIMLVALRWGVLRKHYEAR